MKLSWSHKLFFKINKQIGRRPWLDKLMHICGHELIFVLGFLVAFWSIADIYQQDQELLSTFIKLVMTATAFAFTISWGIGFFFPRRRPIIEFPHTKQLIEPFGTWKSFPSDHTIMSFTLLGIVMIMGAPLWYVLLIGLLASLVAFGRVYVGVHYPRDIIGGVVLAALAVLLSPTLLAHVTQPMYRLVIQLF